MSRCSGKPKGYRFIKKAGMCMSPCHKPAYRMQKSPYYCKTPKARKYSKCPKGFRRHSKSGTCRATRYRLK